MTNLRRAALFLDRDGVINVDHGYVHRPDQVQFVDGIFDLVRAARGLMLEVVVVTNQSGIARGYFSQADFETITRWLHERFAAAGAPLTATYHCPYHPTEGIGDWRRESVDRKPGPGMLLRAAHEHGLDLAASWILGDRQSDIEAGRSAGVGKLLFFRSEKGQKVPPGATGVETLHEARIQLLASLTA